MCTSEYKQLQCFQESATASLLWINQAINETEIWLLYWRQLTNKTLSPIWIKSCCVLPSQISMFSISVQESISTNKILTFRRYLLSRTKHYYMWYRLIEHSHSHRINENCYENWSYSLYSSFMYIHKKESSQIAFCWLSAPPSTPLFHFLEGKTCWVRTKNFLSLVRKVSRLYTLNSLLAQMVSLKNSILEKDYLLF